MKKFSSKAGALSLLAAVILVPLFAHAESSLVRFEGGIGVIPVSAGPAANIVQGVNPGGQPWVIERLSADIKTDGRISVQGRGLLLGGGNSIGTIGGVNAVLATLFCSGIPHNTDGVPLAANGDFRIDDLLSPAPPAGCQQATLLIRNATGGVAGNWFAAGIPN